MIVLFLVFKVIQIHINTQGWTEQTQGIPCGYAEIPLLHGDTG